MVCTNYFLNFLFQNNTNAIEQIARISSKPGVFITVIVVFFVFIAPLLSVTYKVTVYEPLFWY
jgi:hypothetical protein